MAALIFGACTGTGATRFYVSRISPKSTAGCLLNRVVGLLGLPVWLTCGGVFCCFLPPLPFSPYPSIFSVRGLVGMIAKRKRETSGTEFKNVAEDSNYEKYFRVVDVDDNDIEDDAVTMHEDLERAVGGVEYRGICEDTAIKTHWGNSATLNAVLATMDVDDHAPDPDMGLVSVLQIVGGEGSGPGVLPLSRCRQMGMKVEDMLPRRLMGTKPAKFKKISADEVRESSV